jgi:hypothetical protein
LYHVIAPGGKLILLAAPSERLVEEIKKMTPATGTAQKLLAVWRAWPWTTRIFAALAGFLAVNVIIAVTQSALGPLASSPPPGAIRVSADMEGYPQDWQLLATVGLLGQGDHKAASKAFFGYGCKVFRGPTYAWIGERAGGMVCVRPHGEPRCYWMWDDPMFSSAAKP